MSLLFCVKCSGEGSEYASRHGGNDPDVYRIGPCGSCGGSGTEPCSAQGCSENAVGFNDDGDALCSDCLLEWAASEFDEVDW